MCHVWVGFHSVLISLLVGTRFPRYVIRGYVLRKPVSTNKLNLVPFIMPRLMELYATKSVVVCSSYHIVRPVIVHTKEEVLCLSKFYDVAELGGVFL